MMASSSSLPLAGRRVLVVEDEYVIAMDMAQTLEQLGAEVIGPAGFIDEALELVAANERLDTAVLDVNLGNERIWPVAAALRDRGVPFVFASGYDAALVPGDFADVPRYAKPINRTLLERILREQLDGPDQHYETSTPPP